MKVAIIGCGGNSEQRNPIIVCNRTREKTQSLANEIQAGFCSNVNSAICRNLKL